MAARKGEAATVTLTATKPTSMMDWSIKDVHKDFMVFKTHVKIWLETRGVHNYKQ